MVAVAVRAQAKVCAVVASANKAESAVRPTAPRPAAKSVSIASSAAAKTLAATSVAVALGMDLPVSQHTPARQQSSFLVVCPSYFDRRGRIAVACAASNTMSANAMELLAQTYALLAQCCGGQLVY